MNNMAPVIPRSPASAASGRHLNVLISRPNGGGNGGMDRLADRIMAEAATLATNHVTARVVTTRSPKGLHYALPILGVCAARIAAGGLTRRIDVLHLNMASEGSVYRKMGLAALARALGIPYIVHIHSDRFLAFNREASPRVAAAIATFFRQSRGIVVLGRLWSDELSQRIPGIADKFHILPNATPSVPPRAPRPAGAPVHIATLGLLGPRKGTRVLLEALSKLAHRSDWTATLAGNGEVEEARAYARELGIADRVEIPGWLGREESAALLDRTDVFALPSNSEGLPMAILEAFAWGIPVIATNVGAVPEVVDQDVNGLIVPRGDAQALAAALERLVDDRSLRLAFGAAGRDKHERTYRFDIYMQRLIAIWRKAATG